MRKIKIALCDVRHRTMGLHSYQMPLGIGLIASYVLNQMPEDVEFRLYKYYENFSSDLKEWKPDIVGASFFSWNRKLTLHLLKKVKEYNPDIWTVIGGPELEIDKTLRKDFLKENPFIDLCCFGEGEATFLEIVQEFKKGSTSVYNNRIEGTFYLDHNSGDLIENKSRKRIASLDDIPSPYKAGLFDPFFEDYLHPFIESHRGCPFTCRFCHMGLFQNSKVTYQSVERTLEDIEYCAKKYQGRHDIQLCIGDNNFGMYKKDEKLAQGIRRIQDAYDWPRYLVLSTGKNKKERMVKISNTLKWGLPFNMAAQSLNPDSLITIGRKNISLKIMQETLKTVNNANNDSYTELIIGLPKETRTTFEDGLKSMIRIDLNWLSILTLRLLNGTWLTLPHVMHKYDFDTRYRVICRQFGEYDGDRIIETEACGVGTNTMSFDDYCYLREMTFFIMVAYNSDTFNPIRRFLVEENIDIWSWLQEIRNITLNSDSLIKQQFLDFMEETRGELFDTEDDLIQYFSIDDNYHKLLKGEIGDNLINKYSVLCNSIGFEDWLNAIAAAAKNQAYLKSAADYVNEVLDDIVKYIRIVYNFSTYIAEPPVQGEHRTYSFKFDIHSWMQNKQTKLVKFKKDSVYNAYFSEKQIAQIKQIVESSHDLSFTIQRIYRDKNYDDLIPTLIPM